jgi:NAD(P)H-quinone oxidoreductase subunit 5
METPTPVSALLHAGIINAGGLLVLRFAHLMAHAPAALDVLLVVGSISALVGSAVMLTQTSVKVSLAWSTVAQLGFMFMQCGLGAFSAASLHLVAHSLYKAHAFLASGSVIELARARWVPEPEMRPRPSGVVAALLGTAALYVVVAKTYGVWPPANPGEFALGAVVSLGLAHLLANVLTARARASVVLRTAATAGLVLVAYLGLQRLASYTLAGALPGARPLHGLLDTAILTAVLASFAAVTLLQNTLPYRPEGGTWQALHTHLANGLYVNTVVNRWVLAWWPQRARAGVAADGRGLVSRGALP